MRRFTFTAIMTSISSCMTYIAGVETLELAVSAYSQFTGLQLHIPHTAQFTDESSLPHFLLDVFAKIMFHTEELMRRQRRQFYNRND